MSRADLRRRLERIEASSEAASGPLVVLIDPVEADGSKPEINAYACRETGDRWERQPGEAMPDFQRRVEDAAQALPSRPMVIMLTPEDWPEPIA